MPVFAGSGPLVLLYKLTNADMQSTADQAFTKVAGFNEALIINYVAMPKTGVIATSAIGGIYFGASKTNADVPATAIWTPLDATSNPKKFVDVMANTNNGAGTNKLVNAGTLFLSLTTGSTGACTADFYAYGYVMS